MNLKLVPTPELQGEAAQVRDALHGHGTKVQGAARDLGLQVVLVGLALTLSVLALAVAIRSRKDASNG